MGDSCDRGVLAHLVVLQAAWPKESFFFFFFFAVGRKERKEGV